MTFLPERARIIPQPGETVLEMSGRTSASLRSVCGGIGQCTACRVRLVGGEWPPGRIERERLGVLIAAGWRLACQFSPRSAVVVERPPEVLW